MRRTAWLMMTLAAAGCDGPRVPVPPDTCRAPSFAVSAPYLIFFARHSDGLNERDQEVLREVALAWARTKPSMLGLNGNVEPAEARDHGLGLRRASAAASFLIASGVPARHVFVNDSGASQPLLASPPQGLEVYNRRVEFTFSAGTKPPDSAAACIAWVGANYCRGNGADACRVALEAIAAP